MKYAANFGRNERNVELDGEAYFEVAKNKSIPFYVHTETNKVKVVGTSSMFVPIVGAMSSEPHW